MTTTSDGGWQCRALAVDFLIVWFLPVNTAFLTVGILHVPANTHARHSPLAGFKQSNLRTVEILILIGRFLEYRVVASHSKTRHLGESATRDGHIIGCGVSRIPHRWHGTAPSVCIDLSILRVITSEHSDAIMPVFSFRVDDLSKCTRLLLHPLLVERRVEGGRLIHHVFHTALLHGIK